MSGRRKHHGEGVDGYLRRQVETLRAVLPEARRELAGESVHDARVATRRLRAGLGLLAPVLPRQPSRKLNRLGRNVRRELGPIRDADVMIGHLRALKLPERYRAAVEWMAAALQDRQDRSRREASDWPPVEKQLAKLEKRWLELAPQLAEVAEAIPHLLAESLHAQADRFSSDADAIAAQAAGTAPIDPHRLRIDGKQLRYTVELATAHGVRFPAAVLRRLKRLQDALGVWHDHVVLTTTAMELVQQQRLAYLDPRRLREAMLLVQRLTRIADRRMQTFCGLWRRHGAALIRSIRDRVPLDVRPGMASADPPGRAEAATTPRTDPGPAATPAPTAAATSQPATPPGG